MSTPFTSLAAVLIFAQCASSQNMNCTKLTAKCPSADQWSKREGLFNCPGKKRYVCLMTPQTELQEGCIFDTTIHAGKIGCPYSSRCDPRTNQPVLVTHKNYLPCDPDVQGCPPRNHSGYSILKIYEYPKCQGRNGHDDSSVSPERVAPTSSTTPLARIVPIFSILGIIIVIIGFSIIIRLRGMQGWRMSFHDPAAERNTEDVLLSEHDRGENQCATENCRGIVTNDIQGRCQSYGTYLICKECSNHLRLKNVLCGYFDQNIQCGKHDGKTLEYFCEECDIYACNTCITEHPDHRLMRLSVRLDHLKTMIHTKILNSIKSKLASIEFDEMQLQRYNKVMCQSANIAEEQKRSLKMTNNKSIDRLKNLQKDLENKQKRLGEMLETGQIVHLECTLSSSSCLPDTEEKVNLPPLTN